jgi:hypothetical protein
MKYIPCAFKINSVVKEQLTTYCKSHGLKQGFFIEQAIIEKITTQQNNEDISDFQTYSNEKKDAVDFKEYLKKRSK